MAVKLLVHISAWQSLWMSVSLIKAAGHSIAARAFVSSGVISEKKAVYTYLMQWNNKSEKEIANWFITMLTNFVYNLYHYTIG